MKVKTGLTIFGILTVIMVGLGYVGSWWMVPTYRALSPEQIRETIWTPDGALFLFWSLAIPVGAVIASIGLLLYARARGSRVWLFGVGVVLLFLLVALLPMPGYYPPFFGISGGLILAFFLLTLWFWAKRRAQLEGSAATSADFRLVGYLFFLAGMWYLCGVLGPPNYLLDTEKVQQFDSLQSAQTLAMQIFVYFVLGWLFTLLSQYKARQAIK
jgi:hypothetical protein